MVHCIYASQIPYQGYPTNAVGATKVTKDIASYCYDTQRNNIAKTFGHLTSEEKPDYTWPIVGAAVSAISLLALKFIKR